MYTAVKKGNKHYFIIWPVLLWQWVRKQAFYSLSKLSRMAWLVFGRYLCQKTHLIKGFHCSSWWML